MSRKKKVARTLLVVALAVLLCVGGLLVWQWNNVRAIINFTRFSQEELEEKLSEKDQAIKDAVDSIPNITIRDITQEEKDALKEGTLTQEELVQDLIQSDPKPEQQPESKVEQPPKEEKPPAAQPEQPPQQQEEAPQQGDYEKRLSELIAQVYVLREEFLVKLDNLQAEATAAYLAIPVDQRTTKNVANLVSGYLNKGNEMELECDGRIKVIVLEMEDLLEKNGGDLSVAQLVYDTYLEEKSLKKAWYMAELKKRGMM